MQDFIRFILDIFLPEPLLAAGIFEGISHRPPTEPKRSIAEVFGLSFHKGGGSPSVKLATPPAPPVINIPAAPTPPVPPPPTSSQSIYNAAQAGQEAAQQQASGFGYQASLLRLPATSGAPTGPNGTVNAATGTGSILGLK